MGRPSFFLRRCQRGGAGTAHVPSTPFLQPYRCLKPHFTEGALGSPQVQKKKKQSEIVLVRFRAIIASFELKKEERLFVHSAVESCTRVRGDVKPERNESLVGRQQRCTTSEVSASSTLPIDPSYRPFL